LINCVPWVPISGELPLPTKLNTKRVVLSLSIEGAILVPLSTGSLVRFVKHPFEYEQEFEMPTEAAIKCVMAHDVASCDKEKQENLAHPYYSTLDMDRAIRVARDISLGLIVPAFLVLVFPRMIRRYLRWVTS
jgi:hypothetical protein